MIVELVLAITLITPVKVAVIYRGETIIMPLTTARKLHASKMSVDPALRAALDIALGTLPDTPIELVMAHSDRERERWQRQPANGVWQGGQAPLTGRRRP